MPSESTVTIGSMIAIMFFMVIVLGILGPISIAMGVYNPSVNATSPAGQYLTSLFGAQGIQAYANQSLTVNFIPDAQRSANTSLGLASSLQLTSGWAFIYGGISEFFKSLYNFPKFIYVILIQSFSYNGLQKFLPFDLAGLLSIGILGYLSVVLILKLVSIFSKPSTSIEGL